MDTCEEYFDIYTKSEKERKRKKRIRKWYRLYNKFMKKGKQRHKKHIRSGLEEINESIKLSTEF
jgi:hypothetical protein